MFWGLFFLNPLISASILASFWKPFSINVHNFFGIKLCMRFLDACFYQCPPVSCIKIIASTARISRCRRSPRTTINKNTTKKHNLEKGRKRGGALLSFGNIFDLFLLKKCVQKSKRKTMLKKASKITKFKQKTRYDSIPRNAFSHRLSAKAVPPK